MNRAKNCPPVCRAYYIDQTELNVRVMLKQESSKSLVVVLATSWGDSKERNPQAGSMCGKVGEWILMPLPPYTATNGNDSIR